MFPPPIIDIEASGFGRGSYPIEIGFVMPDGSCWCSLIAPLANWLHWDEKAERIHGICREVLRTHGRPALQVAREINRRLGRLTVYCDGWLQDYSWLNRLFEEAELTPSFRLEDVRTLLSEDEAARWHQVKEEILAEAKPERHRASSDAWVLQATLMRVKRLPLRARPQKPA
ncbi:MAG: hypothetical protein HGA47_08635 [Zoogloea sp.]|nr:hypothetical protein [Zoogloea sp.]